MLELCLLTWSCGWCDYNYYPTRKCLSNFSRQLPNCVLRRKLCCSAILVFMHLWERVVLWSTRFNLTGPGLATHKNIHLSILKLLPWLVFWLNYRSSTFELKNLLSSLLWRSWTKAMTHQLVSKSRNKLFSAARCLVCFALDSRNNAFRILYTR